MSLFLALERNGEKHPHRVFDVVLRVPASHLPVCTEELLWAAHILYNIM